MIRKFILYLLIVLLVIVSTSTKVPAEVYLQPRPNSLSNPTNIVDGLHFEILVPQKRWLIPKNQAGAETPIKLGIRITNQTQRMIHLTWFDSVMIVGLNIVDLNNIQLDRKALRDRLNVTSQMICPLLKPGESVEFFRDSKLYWSQQKLLLAGYDTTGSGWEVEIPEPGIYQVQFLYNNNSAVKSCYEPSVDFQTPAKLIIANDLWTGLAATPFVRIHLISSPD